MTTSKVAAQVARLHPGQEACWAQHFETKSRYSCSRPLPSMVTLQGLAVGLAHGHNTPQTCHAAAALWPYASCCCSAQPFERHACSETCVSLCGRPAQDLCTQAAAVLVPGSCCLCFAQADTCCEQGIRLQWSLHVLPCAARQTHH